MTELDVIRTELATAPDALERFLRGFLYQNVERYAYGELFEPIYRDLTNFVLRRGKRIRPMLLLLAYRIFGGDRPMDHPSLLKSAAALELLHTFVLIHDDIIDRSERRRGFPTFHKMIESKLAAFPQKTRTGENVAMIVGDMLFALAMDTLIHTDFPTEQREAAMTQFLRYVTDTGCGEIYDILLGVRDIAEVSELDIEMMYTLKTTRYTFEAPLVIGATLAGAPPEALGDLANISEPLGLAFQIQNDLAEHAQDVRLNTPLQTDLIEGKKTLLLRFAFEQLDSMDRSFLQLCLGSTQENRTAMIKTRELIEKSGAAAVLQDRMMKLFAQADAHLVGSGLTSLQRDGISEAVQFIRAQMQT